MLLFNLLRNFKCGDYFYGLFCSCITESTENHAAVTGVFLTFSFSNIQVLLIPGLPNVNTSSTASSPAEE